MKYFPDAIMGYVSCKGVKVVVDLNRITRNPLVMGGKACVRGMRVTVGMIVGQIGAGRSIEELLADYPYLEREDIFQALRYAAWRMEEREIELAPA
jgi:uncharacterized protein (DUF433 family)